jgi:phosphoglucomutase
MAPSVSQRPALKFGTSGWRAVIADEFTFANARRAVAGIAAHLVRAGRSGRLLVGHDTRFLAGEFALQAARLLAERGFEVGLADRPIPTPVLAFEIVRQKAIGGINFTASHNPPQYLGLKFSTADGAPALPEETRKIEKEIARIGEAAEPSPGPADTFDPVPAYLEALSRLVSPADLGRGMALGLDFRFGTSAGFLDEYFERAEAKISPLHANPDPLFGGSSPQCSARELIELAAVVREKKCALGLATDGDADRFGVLDEKGRYVAPNSILALLAWDLCSRGAVGKGIARSIATTHALDAVAKKFGVPVYETPVGFKFIGELLLEGKISFGGEESAGLTVEGHVPDKDGILADALVARAVARDGRTVTDLLVELESEIGPFHSARADIPLSPTARKKLAALARNAPSEFGQRRVERADTTDGLKLALEDEAWILFRESGTEPVARVYAESRSAGDTEKLLSAGRGLLEG